MNTEKRVAIDLALSKLTEEEKELLGLVKKPKKPKVKKNYKLKILYMIGDADGHTDTEETISVNNPFLKILTEALDKLTVLPSKCGIVLNDEQYHGNYKQGNINKLEYDLLCLVSGYNDDEDIVDNFLEEYNFENIEKNHDYLSEFEGLFISETEYSFLVYQDYKLK